MAPISNQFVFFRPIASDDDDLEEFATTGSHSSMSSSSSSAAASRPGSAASPFSPAPSFVPPTSPFSVASRGSSSSSKLEDRLQSLIEKCGKQTGSLLALGESKRLLREMKGFTVQSIKMPRLPKKPFKPDPISSIVMIGGFHIRRTMIKEASKQRKMLFAQRIPAATQELPSIDQQPETKLQ